MLTVTMTAMGAALRFLRTTPQLFGESPFLHRLMVAEVWLPAIPMTVVVLVVARLPFLLATPFLLVH
jgi:hypothetical protein